MTKDKPFYFRLDGWICQHKNKTGNRWTYSQWGKGDKEVSEWISVKAVQSEKFHSSFAIWERDTQS